MDYNFSEIEKKWQKVWREQQTYKVVEDASKTKFYVLNMFPYPSGAGLHVGHPLGYIASDIYARYKRQQGFNVLNPMGYDAYGLPAEQYAIQTGQHPALTTETNIAHYREQLDKIGFSFDWSREVRTCDPSYYHWTQWAFEKMFSSYFDNDQQKALPIDLLVKHFEAQGTAGLHVAQSEELSFTAAEWKAYDEAQRIIRISEEVKISLDVVEKTEEFAEENSDKQYNQLTAAKLAEKWGIDTAECNKRLCAAGLQELQGKSYHLTEKGKAAGGIVKKGKFGYFIVWPDNLSV